MHNLELHRPLLVTGSTTIAPKKHPHFAKPDPHQVLHENGISGDSIAVSFIHKFNDKKNELRNLVDMMAIMMRRFDGHSCVRFRVSLHETSTIQNQNMPVPSI